MAKLAKALNTNTLGDLKALAEILQRQGRGRDTILAHITPKEARYLKERGGRGSKNPMTGLLEYDGADVPTPTPDVPAAPASLPDVTVSAPASSPAVDVPITPDVSLPSAPSAGPSYPSAYGYSDVGAAPSMGTGLAPPATPELPAAVPAQLSQIDTQGLISPETEAAATTPVETTDKPSIYDRLAKAVGGPDALKRLGLAGALGLYGASTSRKAAGQAQAAQAEQQALATPYQTAGRQMIGAAEKGQLTPASMQAYQAAQAQLAQKGAITGGVGAQQAAVQLEEFRQKLLEQQYNYGLQVAGIGDQIALGAIRTGLQLDQAMAQSTQNFYTSLAAIASGIPFKTGG